VLTTPADLSQAFLQCIRRLADRVALEPHQLRYIFHATTVATNAVLERRGARAGLLVTQGFRDILEIARQVRYELYNLQTEKPPALIPRERCLEIPERVNYRGEVLVPLEESAVLRAAESFKSHQVDSIAVCFLHAYANPVNERKAAEILRRLCPGVPISLASQIAPEIREYWRASTVATNAYIAPIVAGYLHAVEERLQSNGISAPVRVMQSSGGIMTVETAKERPVYMLESGPAAGVVAARYFAELAGYRDALSFDMGGTTAKMGLILNGKAKVVSEFEAGGISGSGSGTVKGSGYPILAPVIDIVEVGAGGGSIAWIDSGGLMRVGPQSAGADPGPACYGRGGIEPTITDANLLLGRLSADYFLGGEMPLRVEMSREAIVTNCAVPLRLDEVSTAMGIVDIANATMVEAMRLISVQRGHDPGEFCLIAFGGAGPMHANRLASELGIPTVIVPPSPGVASALGMLLTDLRHDYYITRLQRLDEARFEELNALAHDFRARGLTELAHEGVNSDQITVERYLDMRYVGQSWKLRIPFPDRDWTRVDCSHLKETFHQFHEQTYGYCCREEPVEIVNIGALTIGRLTKPRLKEIPRGSTSPDHAQKSTRFVYFQETGTFIETPVFDRYTLQQGNIMPGPAVIEEIDSTTIVHPGYAAEVMCYGILIFRKVA
jgi:N-methylhydantoinase A